MLPQPSRDKCPTVFVFNPLQGSFGAGTQHSKSASMSPCPLCLRLGLHLRSDSYARNQGKDTGADPERAPESLIKLHGTPPLSTSHATSHKGQSRGGCCVLLHLSLVVVATFVALCMALCLLFGCVDARCESNGGLIYGTT